MDAHRDLHDIGMFDLVRPRSSLTNTHCKTHGMYLTVGEGPVFRPNFTQRSVFSISHYSEASEIVALATIR